MWSRNLSPRYRANQRRSQAWQTWTDCANSPIKAIGRGAAEYGHRLLARDRLNPAAHFYQALVFEHLGIPAEAELSLRRAIYLDRNFALAHYHLGLTLRRDRQIEAAARSFGNVLKVLSGVLNHATVTGAPGVTVNGLKELARMHLDNSGAS